MTRSLFALLLATSVLPLPLAAQYRNPRSADYLFGASTWGSRALWVNPASMGVMNEASVMLEGMVERDPAGDFPLVQYTIGFSSRGFGFGFRRDRFRVDQGLGLDSLETRAGNTWRVGIGRGLGPLAIGAAVSLYSGENRRQDVDIGFRYRVASTLDVAFAVEHIGQPVVRDSSLRFGGTAGLAWTPMGGVLGIDLEVRGADGLGNAGMILGYRGGLRVQIPGRVPFAMNAVLELNDEFDVGRLLVGLTIGPGFQAGAVAGGARESGTSRLTSLSVLAEARTRLR